MSDDLSELRRAGVPRPGNVIVSSKTLEIEAAFPHVQPLLRSLKMLGSAVIWAQRRSHPSLEDHGIVLIRFSGQIESQFGLTREVALVVIPYADIRYQTFHDLPSILLRLPRNVTERIVLVSSRDPREADKLDDWSSHDRLVIGVGSVRGGAREAAKDLARLLRGRIYSRNPYAATAPVQDDAFFGRRLLLQEMLDSARQQRPISLVGLRKAGKTSLLKQTAIHLSRDNESVMILRDLESLPELPAPVVPDLLKDIAQDLISSMAERGFRMTGLEALGERPSVSEFRRAAKSDLQKASEVRNVVVALDEIEYVCPPRLLEDEGDACVQVTQLLGALRSLVQETDNFSFLIAGLTPDIFRRGMLYGRHNPLFSWVAVRHVHPFSEEEAGEMLRALGSRMGLEWERDAIGLAVTRAGGHAFMLRTLGAVIAGTFNPEDTSRVVTAELVRRCIPEWRKQVQPNVDEAVAHVRRYYSVESQFLDLLTAKGHEGVPATERVLASSALSNLLDLGLAVRVRSHPTASSIRSVQAVDFLLK